MNQNILVVDGNEAAADIAYRINEICIIYPITPASTMGELSDYWSAAKVPNVWHNVPDVIEMQSEAGAVGAIHGALQTGALATTFTASQGLLLMIPEMYRISAELTPTVFHIAARTVAAQGMSIHSDHTDIMSTRSTGFAMLCSSNVQEIHDFALISQAASLKSRVPFLHFFDGLRTGYEMNKIFRLTDDEIKKIIDDELIISHRERRMSPSNPFVRGVIYDADIYFQQREAVNSFYADVPEIVTEYMQKLAALTGREYKTVEYSGHPEAERVIVIMGSGGETVRETVLHLQKFGEKVGVLQVKLFQPFPIVDFIGRLPKSCKAIAVLDRTKESGAGGEPLYQKVSTAILESFNNGDLADLPKVIGGRFGLGGKEFNPSMVMAVFAELQKKSPKNHFTVGIEDDVMHHSLPYDDINIENNKVIRAIFYGLGADGTISANRNSIKIIGEETDFNVQGYFVFDGKKSGSRTVSHLRFSPDKIYSTYLISSANFVGCHQFSFLNRIDVLNQAKEGATFLLNSPYSAEEVWDYLPCSVQETIINKQLQFYVVDAYRIANETGMGERINTIMQTCFFALANVLPRQEAIEKIKDAIAITYADKGEKVIKQNFLAVDHTLANLFQVKVPATVSSTCKIPRLVDDTAPEFVRYVINKMLEDKGNELPVSAFLPDGTYPIETTKWEKRNISLEVPSWDSEACIQCGRCSLVCPHGVIRAKSCSEKALKNAPDSFKTAPLKGKNNEEQRFILQSYIEDCTGCGACVEACPVKNKAINLVAKDPILEEERQNIKFFERLPYGDRSEITNFTVNNVQFLSPMFEFSGACAGCGETPYTKLLTQLFGERMIIANACGCSSVCGGYLPAIPWTKNADGHGPSWSSSLFEDNAEFGLGFRLTADNHRAQALELLVHFTDLNADLITEIQKCPQENDEEIIAQLKRVAFLKEYLKNIDDLRAKKLLSLADFLTKQSVWSIGGDGWAYDIGFGGLDHVVASNKNVNLLVLDTEVYSNTGGQASKATSRGSVVKYASSGKNKAKKELGLMMMTYGNVYVASISLGANPAHAIKTIKEAESYPGTSLILAYSHCIAHGINMRYGMKQQELAVKSGYWPLYRYNPELAENGKNPFQLDSAKPTISLEEYARNENRFAILFRNDPERAKHLMKLAQEDVDKRWRMYEKLAEK